jgi:hypothetical protein
MNAILWLLISMVYPLLGALIFVSIDRQEIEAHVAYGEIPAVVPLSTIRCTILIISCIFWLPALLAGGITEIWGILFRTVVLTRK